MNKRIVFLMPSGSVSIAIPLEPMLEDESEDEYIARIAHRAKYTRDGVDTMPGSKMFVIDNEGIPEDRSFRAAWSWLTDDPVIDIDMIKAKDIHRDRLRSMRAPKLAQLDIDYMRALESGDSAKATEIAASKQVLRDVTTHPNIAAAKTPSELKLVIPECLL